MRFAAYDLADDAAERCGVVIGDMIHPLPEGTPLALIDAGRAALEAAGQGAAGRPARDPVPVSGCFPAAAPAPQLS